MDMMARFECKNPRRSEGHERPKGLAAKYKKNGLQYQTGGHKAAVGNIAENYLNEESG